MLSSKSFIDLALTFRSRIHFELNLAYGVKFGPNSFFLLLAGVQNNILIRLRPSQPDHPPGYYPSDTLHSYSNTIDCIP